MPAGPHSAAQATIRSIEQSHASGERFCFGENWASFLERFNESRIEYAQRCLLKCSIPQLTGRTFLDIGCGTGLWRPGARRAGATVHSFDYD